MRSYRALAGSPVLFVAALALAGCGGGGSGTNSTPAPQPSPGTPPPPTINFNTQEYSQSNAASFDHAITAWQNGASGAGITVGVIDTGIDVSSPEFSGRISSASAAYGGNSSIQDVDGHGTAVTGILAAARDGNDIMGVAFSATIMTLRADSAGTCSTSSGCDFYDTDITAALNHATDNGARVVNISLGGAGGISPQLQQAVNRATSAGIVIVLSAGNERDQASPSYDPNNPSPFALSILSAGNGLVIVANSVDSNGQISVFSDLAGSAQNYVIGALGEGVRSIDIVNDPLHYYVYSGTSFAAPQVTGAIALLQQAFPNLTSAQIVDLLLRTATDAGATGTDSIYGRGILNIAAAFAPAGSTSLGNSAVPVSLTNNGSLSGPMGDVSGSTSTQAIAVDGLGRAYALGLQATLAKSAPHAALAPLIHAPLRETSLNAPGLSATLGFASLAAPRFDRFGQPLAMTDRSSITGRIAIGLNRRTALSIGFRQQGDALLRTLGNEAPASGFIAARNAAGNLGFEPLPRYALALRHRLGSGLSLGVSGEAGEVFDPMRRNAMRADAPGRYGQATATLGWHGGPLSVALGGSVVTETDSLLGARLAPFFGIAGGRSVYADMRSTLALPGHWSLSLSARRGWTGATGGGRARIGSLAWHADVGRTGFLDGADRIGLRVAQPLRVISGGVDALLPVAYDYASARSDWRTTRIGLSPKGREIDMEATYARPFAGGWLSLNTYLRRQPGNIAWAADDIGGALRFTVGY